MKSNVLIHVMYVITTIGNFLWAITGKFPFSIILLYHSLSTGSWIKLLFIPFTFFITSGCYNIGLNLGSLKSLKQLRVLLSDKTYQLAKLKLPSHLFQIIKNDLDVRKRSLKMGGYNLKENNITLLLITNPEKKAKAPQAFPNHINESYVLIPSLDFLSTNVPIRKFIFFHELEHCTSFSVKLESEKISLPIFFSILMFFLLSLSYSINTIQATIILILSFRVISKLRREIPEMSEAQTDMRALSRISIGDAEDLVKSLRILYNSRGKDALEKRRNIKTWYYRSIMMDSYLELLKQKKEFKANQISHAVKKLGTRNLSGPLFSIVYSFLIYQILIHLVDIPNTSLIVTAILMIVVNIIGASLGVRRERKAKEVNQILDCIRTV